jgi:hypothetical protein
MPVVNFEASSASESLEGDISTLYQDEEANWHTVTAKGRKIRTPARYRETAATAMDANPYAAFSDDEDEGTDAA